MIEKLREQKKEWTEVERAAQENDQITIAFFRGLPKVKTLLMVKLKTFRLKSAPKK